ncbi:hypothetical protein FHG87_019762 [Trinorchestia longiramus]|nr:hypothetical protein FHG87_019762 [Trinorchestia longiramus]
MKRSGPKIDADTFPVAGSYSFPRRVILCECSKLLNLGTSSRCSCFSVSQSGPYRPPGGVEEMQRGGRRVRLEWGAYITV